MSLKQRMRSLDRITQFVVLGRLAACPLILGIYLWSASLPTHDWATAVGTVIYLAYTPVAVTMLLRGTSSSSSRFLTAYAIVDGIALGFLTAGLGMYEDPTYAWYVVSVAVLSVLARGRQLRVLTSLMVVSYVLGHLLGHPILTPMAFLFIGVKASALFTVNLVVAYTLGQREERQVSLESHQADILELNDRLERSVAELRAITEITELIHSTLEVESVGATLLDILEKVIDIPAGSLYVIDKTKQETIFSTSSLGASAGTRAYSGLELAGAMPVGASDGSLSCIELIDHNETVVVFCAETVAMEALSSDDRVVLQAVASELVVAVENSRLYRLTKRLAITDELTDLYNYRYLQQRLEEEIGRADRYNKRLSMLMLDLDDFKRVNDTHGHLIGDRALAEVGQVLKSTVREVDVVARYGGEEFTIILPETDAPGAFIVAEKIREAISAHRFPDVEGGRSVHITVSIGLSSYPVHAHDKESLLRSADDAVYRAKETGKDRVRAPRLRLRRVVVGLPQTKEDAE